MDIALLIHAYIKAAAILGGGFGLLVVVCNIDPFFDWWEEVAERRRRRRELKKLARRYYRLYAEADTDRLRGYYYGRYRMYETEAEEVKILCR